MKTKQLTFQYEVERPLATRAPNGDDTEAITLKVTATAIPDERYHRDNLGDPPEITDLEIKGPDGNDFPATASERERIIAAALEHAAGLWEDTRYEQEDAS